MEPSNKREEEKSDIKLNYTKIMYMPKKVTTPLTLAYHSSTINLEKN